MQPERKCKLISASLYELSPIRARVPTPQAVVSNIRRYSSLGLSVNLSEMDVRISKLPDYADKEQAQCDIYSDILRDAYSEKNFEG